MSSLFDNINNIKIDFEDFTEEQALKEAQRCLNCKNPFCKKGCPIQNNIPEFIKEIKNKNFQKAYEYIEQKSNLPAICGKICCHEKQCQGSCILNRKSQPIKIGALENFVANYNFEKNFINLNKSTNNLGKVCIIGSGPAGLSCAYILLKENFSVTIYEKEKEFGGILTYGIPKFRLKYQVVKKEIDKLQKMGAKFINNTLIGKEITLNHLKNQFDAIFIATGSNYPKNINIPGEHLDGVFHANEFLEKVFKAQNNEIQVNDLKIYQNDEVLVIGGGNVAIDTARTIKKITDNVKIVYRRTKEEMPASNEEYQQAIKDGIEFIWRCSPLEFVGEKNKLKGLKVKNLDTQSEFIINADKVFNAIGSKAYTYFPELEVNDKNYIKIFENPFGQTNIEGVFSAGDVVHGAETVVLAMREARKTAFSIINYILKK